MQKYQEKITYDSGTVLTLDGTTTAGGIVDGLTIDDAVTETIDNTAEDFILDGSYDEINKVLGYISNNRVTIASGTTIRYHFWTNNYSN